MVRAKFLFVVSCEVTACGWLIRTLLQYFADANDRLRILVFAIRWQEFREIASWLNIFG